MKTIITAKAKLKEIEMFGVLKQAKDGFVYLDISNDIINGLFSILNSDDKEKPPYNLKSFNTVGAHVSVIGTDEYNDNEIGKIEELGEEVIFKPDKFYQVNPEGWEEMEKVYFLSVKSPRLEEIRKKYGLIKKQNDNEFHITFAVERK